MNLCTDITPEDAFAFVGDKLTYWVDLREEADFPLSEVSIIVTPFADKRFWINITLANVTHGYFGLDVSERILGRTRLNCWHNEIVCSASVYVESK